VRNLSMLAVIPTMCILHHRNSAEGGEAPRWWKMVPLFVIGFAAMSLIRTVGDMGDQAFGLVGQSQWHSAVEWIKRCAEACLAVAMASVGLGTDIRDIIGIGLKPLAMGLTAALLVGLVSVTLITLIY
jgi:uncharacterized membrane protein YadS